MPQWRGYLGAGEVDVCEIVEDGVDCVVLPAQGGHPATPAPDPAPPALGGQGALQVVRGAALHKAQGASHVSLLKR